MNHRARLGQEMSVECTEGTRRVVRSLRGLHELEHEELRPFLTASIGPGTDLEVIMRH